MRGALGACLVGMLFACGSGTSAAFGAGSSSGGSGGSADSGSEDTGAGDVNITGEAGANDGGNEAGIATGGLFVHASPDLPDLRFCWAVSGDASLTFSTTDVPFPSGAPAAFSNYPAVPVGGAAPLADASSMLGGDLHLVGLEANTLAMIEPAGTIQKSCHDLLKGSGSGFPPQAIFTFPVIPGGTVVGGSTNLIAVAGCLPTLFDPSATTQLCGSSWSGLTGNLHVDVHPFYEVTSAAAGQLPVQAAQLSPAFASLLGDGGVAVVSFGTQGAGGSPVATLSAEGTVDPMTAAVLDAGTAPTGYGQLGFGVDVTGFDGGAGHLWMSLEQSLRLVAPMTDPAKYYAAQTTFIVAVVGDPSAPHAGSDAAYDGTGLHVLVLPLP